MQRRLTIAEIEKITEMRMLYCGIKNPWNELREIVLQLGKMLDHNTTDGLPYVEPPLTDKDALDRPWVMVKTIDSSLWQGPFILIREKDVGIRYIVENHRHGAISGYTHVRRATKEEIAAAGLEVTERARRSKCKHIFGKCSRGSVLSAISQKKWSASFRRRIRAVCGRTFSKTLKGRSKSFGDVLKKRWTRPTLDFPRRIW
jgi:hypothetical protein